MKCHRRSGVPRLACLVAFTVIVRTASAQDAATERPPATRIEEALIEYRCDGGRPTDETFDARSRCLDEHLAELRGDFGDNLGRLSASERKKIDAACPSSTRPETRDAYIRCLDASLRALHERWLAANPPAAVEASAEASQPGVAGSQAIAPSTTMPRATAGIIFAVGIMVLAGGGMVVARRRRQPAPRACRVCGVARLDGGDLCPMCRHDAALAARRKTEDGERGTEDGERGAESGKRGAGDGERSAEIDAIPLHAIPFADATPVAHEEPRAEPVETTPPVVATPQPAVVEISPAAPVETEPSPARDPYTLLGVTPQSTAADIRAAYEAALVRYDESAVSFLGNDVQQHFAAMRRAVEDAYRAVNQ